MVIATARRSTRPAALVRACAAVTVCILQACATEVTEEVATGSQGVSPNDPSWGCYDPQPGHPTAAEQQSFVARVGRAAQRAEAEVGVPAAAIAAMAAVESGYGFTRTALYAQNYFGYKMPAGGAGSRGSYTLECQPAWDVGNVYVVFASLEDSVSWVANRLATSSLYAPTTQRYQADRRAGVDVVTAVNRWVEGITYAGYNPYHEQYIAKITGAIARHRLYALSENASASPSPDVGGGSEPQPPSSTGTWVAIDQPAENQTVSGTVPIVVTTGGGTEPVTKVLFYSVTSAGHRYLIATDSTPPFEIGWATAGWVPNGSYQLVVEAYVGETKAATGVRRVNVLN